MVKLFAALHSAAPVILANRNEAPHEILVMQV